MKAYLELEKRFERISHLQHALSILGWDEAVIMPPESGEARARSKATLSVLQHEILSRPDTRDLIQAAKDSSSELSDWQKSNLALIERQWLHSSCLPASLVEKSSRASSRCEVAWREQRHQNDWKSHRPLLQEVLDCQREIAKIKSQVFALPAYDALLDQYEAGLRSSTIDQLFSNVISSVPPMIKRVLKRQESVSVLRPKQSIPADRQEKIGRLLMEKLGFDFKRGRLDQSHHPFCGGVPQDVRLTTRYSEDDFISSLMGILHETGHAKYEQNLPKDWQDQPVGQALGMPVHESQSLFLEMQICRSKNFLKFLRPLLIEIFALDEQDPTWSVDNLYSLYTYVRPGYIRIDADELTYPLHICLRYEIEKKLIEGSLELADLPEIWNEKMQSYLGIDTRENFKDGCMQDIHWPAGLFGYFPCYTLGAMMAAQWYEKVINDIPELPEMLSQGEFEALTSWLEANIHSQGSKYTAIELVSRITGKSLSPNSYLKHLEKRYLEQS